MFIFVGCDAGSLLTGGDERWCDHFIFLSFGGLLLKVLFEYIKFNYVTLNEGRSFPFKN